MKIVIGGAGKVGSLIIEELAAEDHELILIEKQSDVLEQSIAKADISGLVGSASSIEDLLEAGVGECDFYLALTPHDETNIISAIMADRLGAGQSLARVRNPEYSSHMNFIRNSLGINQLINPELEAARDIAKLLKYPAALSLESFANGRALVIELEVPANTPLVGLNLMRFRQRYPNLLVGAIARESGIFIPSGKSMLEAGDHLLILGTAHNLDPLYRDLGNVKTPQREALVVGGGSITHYLLKMMEESHTRFTVIELNRKVAEELAANYPEHTIIHGDGTDYAILQEQNIADADLFLALTGVDEENILTSLYAKKMGVKRFVTKVNRTQMLDILGTNQLQAVITPKRIIADRVLRTVRATQNSQGSNVEALYRLLNNQVEALEFNVKGDAEVIGVPLMNLDIKPDCLVALISRGRDIIFPSGQDKILPGDHIVVMSSRDRFDDIDDILKEA